MTIGLQDLMPNLAKIGPAVPVLAKDGLTRPGTHCKNFRQVHIELLISSAPIFNGPDHFASYVIVYWLSAVAVILLCPAVIPSDQSSFTETRRLQHIP